MQTGHFETGQMDAGDVVHEETPQAAVRAVIHGLSWKDNTRGDTDIIVDTACQ